VYARCPDDATLACSTNELISDASFPFATEHDSPNFLGDYTGLTISGSYLFATWTDSRIGRPAVYGVAGIMP